MNEIPKELLLSVGAALLCAFVVSFLMCPLVKSFAYKIGRPRIRNGTANDTMA